MPRLTVSIDTDLCISAANCVGIAPKLFQIGDDPYAEILNREGVSEGQKYTWDASDAEVELLQEAVDSCPTQAIRVTAG
jgi:ferredoxin